MEEIYIFGHKNPDTDTICSAMVKEILNKKNGCEKSKAVTGDENVQLIEENITPVYECDCSKEHMEDGLATLDKDVLKEMIEEDGKAELVCHFCNKKYEFSKEELEDILEKNKK